MATWTDVNRLALALPETAEGTSYGQRSWKVKQKSFLWERPLRKSDLEALGANAPKGPILGVRVESLEHKEALLALDPRVYPLIADAWRSQAPRALAKAHPSTAR
jgi:hypothetical protein